MKTLRILLVILAMAVNATSTAIAHEGQSHAAGGGIFGLPPEYIHVLLNPIPGYGLAMGVLALAFALVARNKTAQIIGIGLVTIACASVWPVTHFGTNAYKHIRELSDDVGVDALDEHMERAEKVVWIFYATTFLGVVALVSRKKFPKATTPLAVTTLLFGVASLGAGGWIAKAGGQIRHPEFRVMLAAATKPESHEKTQHAESGGHQHDETTSHAEKTLMPDTIEGVWKSIHEHHGELELSVNAKQFKEVPSHAKMISDLAKRLIEVSHPDHKRTVKSGVNKIVHALDELKSSAETGSETVMQTSFKEFEKASDELEQQMKKQ